jgi:predicted O-methyltransferase YrrM
MRKNSPSHWTAVDRYFGDLFAAHDEPLEAALKANRAARLPAIDVSPLQGKFLHVLVQMTQAKRVLEIGTLGGYSTIWMARALPKGGRIVSLEFEPRHAEIARANLRCAGLLRRVEIRVGPALKSLPDLKAEGAGPFDLVFIDADKESNPQYLEWAVIEAKSSAPDIRGTRRCLEMMASNPRLSAVALQTVGVKGLDGFAMAVVLR